MSVGFDREITLVALGDSVDLYAHIFDQDDEPVQGDDLASVAYTIQLPDASSVTLDAEVKDDGAGFLRFVYTSQEGHHRAIARFTYVDGQVRSTRIDFEVFDPFNPPVPTALEVVAEGVWMKLEDCFDAEQEGPWLRDMTLNYFNEEKMAEFVNDALFDVNNRVPLTSLGVATFVTGTPPAPTADFPMLTQATLIQVLNHLMRAYTEQPNVAGAQVYYEDRRDYMQRWGTIYQIEYDKYKIWIALYKRKFMGLGASSQLLDTKAGRLMPAPMRVRSTGRGFF